jgi:hypothetical protein
MALLSRSWILLVEAWAAHKLKRLRNRLFLINVTIVSAEDLRERRSVIEDLQRGTKCLAVRSAELELQ